MANRTNQRRAEVSDRFNEGLEQGISLGIVKERERIIKDLVLEIETAKDLHEADCYLSGMEHALLLIKGEQK
jgi:ribosome-binding factor A